MSYKSAFVNFEPVWFISVMGTGISTAILYNFPYEGQWLKILSIIMYAICSFCLGASTILFILKLLFDEKRKHILINPQFNVFLGCYAMGFTSWVTGLHYLTDQRFPIAIYCLWWVGIFMALFTGWFIFFNLIKSSKLIIEEMNSTVLLPIVALTVISSQGQIIFNSLPENLKLSTIVISYLLWSNAMVVAFIITTIYFYRLLFFKLPPKGMIFTSFIPIGFLGQGSFGIQLFGSNLYDYLIEENEIQAEIFKAVSLLSGLFLQSVGFFFTFFAISSIIAHKFQKFNYSFWAITFPLGTMSLAANETYKLTQWTTFRVLASIFGVILLLITTSCIIGSLYLILKPIPKLEQKTQIEEKDFTSFNFETEEETV